jgi:hypothetical protein
LFVSLALGAAQAQAAVLGFDAVLSIDIGILPPVRIEGSGSATVAGAGLHINMLTLPASLFDTRGRIVSVPGATSGIGGLELTVRNNVGNFSGGPHKGTLRGVMQLSGVTKVCLFVACDNATTPPPANLNVPLNNVGSGGTTFLATLINVTMRGGPWTTGSAAVGTIFDTGFQHGPASLSSTAAQHGGSVHLVTPVFVSTSLGQLAVVPTFAFLDLHFAPEPGTLLLLGTGIAGLALYGRTKRS